MSSVDTGERDQFLRQVEADYGKDIRARCHTILTHWPVGTPATAREVIDRAFEQRTVADAETFRRFGDLRYDSD
jgi:hypothetical protein